MNELNLKVTVPNELAGELFQKGLAAILDRCTVSVMGAETVTTKPQPIVIPEPEGTETPRVRKKLIKFICPDCGKLNFAVVEEENRMYSMTCRGCRQEFEFTNMDLMRVEYTCAGCGEYRYYFTPFMEGMEVKTDECKCGHKTKMKYNAAMGGFCVVEG